MLNYRPDIDGLRAVAVLSVLFYHLEFLMFKGGFIGVDIFFTISGFLISGIVLKESAVGTFSFSRFYCRRAIRLLPAYLTVVFFTLLFGILILTPFALKSLIESAISSSLFASNFYFLFTQGGYFSKAVHEIPLLHTWSLSVEEQFYLFMPLAVILWLKIPKNTIKIVTLVIVFLLSLFISYTLTEIHQPASYFLVVSRVHEFLIGSILAVVIQKYSKIIVPSQTVSNILFSISLAVVLYTAASFTAKSQFPGLLAIFPCLATVFIIYAGLNNKCISHRLLGNRVIVFVGLLSYSLYLWHWPLIAYTKQLGITFDFNTKVLLLLLSFILSYFSWRFIEQKCRFKNWTNKNVTAVVLYVSPCILLIITFLYSQDQDFFPSRFEPNVVMAEAALNSKPEEGRDTCHTNSLSIDISQKCLLGSKVKSSEYAVLWGDSHANHFTGFIDILGKGSNVSIRDITRGNCPPLMGLYINTSMARETCIEKNRIALEFIIESKPTYVFLAAAWGGYVRGNLLQYQDDEAKYSAIFSSLRTTINILIDKGVKPIIIEMLPRQNVDLSTCYLKAKLKGDEPSPLDCQVDLLQDSFPLLVEKFTKFKKEYSGKILFISPENLFCEEFYCLNYAEGIPLYRDSNHLNLQGSRLLGQRYLRLNKSLQKDFRIKSIN
ncbi:MAG: peptidoglycan/LPS O-acetylase OafA/YrhL [Alteromonadaceae bacterium]|jgi:peptidoglycan/LPS O-acetylase OafA/YrhL